MTAATSPATVDAYIDALDGDAKRFAIEFRAIILSATPGITEAISYKMPAFLLDGRYFVYFGSWKQHLGLYPVPVFDGDLETEVGPLRAAKDTVRFMYKDPIPTELVERIITEMVRRKESAD